ncbi:MAG: cytochrome P450 [Burkholderiales bacterium]|nr:cytochrome P450 [Burkholderiales bacterium]
MAAVNRLLPGSEGLPLVGETLDFAKNVFAFIGRRRARHGDVFRTHILGSPTVFIAGPKHTATWLDPTKIQRAGALPGNLLALFGGDADIVPLLDGEVHAQRKRCLLAAFSPEAIAAYLPGLESRMEALLAKWLENGEGPVTAELKTLAIESLAESVMGLKPGGPELTRLLAENAILAKAFTALPINLPGTAFAKGLQARDRILALLEGVVQRHIDSPPPDGLSRILAAAKVAGAPLDAKTAAREMHHFLLAGMIVYAELAATLRVLHEHPQVRERLRAEVLAHAPSGPVSPARLRAMPYLAQVVDEVKRTCPNVPMSFGRAKTDIDIAGCTIPRGTLVMMAVYESNLATVFTAPEKFDPERFSPERDERKRAPDAFAPQGAGELTGHKCAGFDFATVMMQLFAVLALRTATWDLPEQDLSIKWVVPPEHRSGLVVRWAKAKQVG